MTTLRTIAGVICGEGVRSALRRARERAGESVREASLRSRGLWTHSSPVPRLDVVAAGAWPRLGGVQAQLAARLDDDRRHHPTALLRRDILELSSPVPHARRVARDFESGIREAMAITGAGTLHIEGLADVPLAALLRVIDAGVPTILSLHDFTLFCARPHLFEEPMHRFCFYSEDLGRCHRCLLQSGDVAAGAQLERRALGRRILQSASGIIVPSQFLLDEHRRLFSLPALQAEIREPQITPANFDGGANAPRRVVAFAGSVKRHKGAHLLSEVARLSGTTIHVLGGGDAELLRAFRRDDRLVIHGYYRAGQLPSLLRRNGIGLVLFPSIVPESFGLVLSEAWQAAAHVAAFDLGAQAERIRTHGNGSLTSLESGAAGLAEIIRKWMG